MAKLKAGQVNKYWRLTIDKGDNEKYFEETKAYLQSFERVASKEEIGKYTIIHSPYYKDFTPIALAKDHVFSESTWKINEFYQSLCYLLRMSDDGYKDDFGPGYRMANVNILEYNAEIRGYDDDWTYKWGCRYFSKDMLLYIKKQMEATYHRTTLNKKKVRSL